MHYTRSNSFQKVAIALTAVIGTFVATKAQAHGSIPDQAVEAIKSATHSFMKSEAAEVKRNFAGISAKWLSHETFQVAISLKTGTSMNYLCVENESVEPVVWECKSK